MEETLVQVTSKYFCAGVIIEDGKVTYAAPIVWYMVGWSEGKFRGYVEKKGWKVCEV